MAERGDCKDADERPDPQSLTASLLRDPVKPQGEEPGRKVCQLTKGYSGRNRFGDVDQCGRL